MHVSHRPHKRGGVKGRQILYYVKERDKWLVRETFSSAKEAQKTLDELKERGHAKE